MGEKRNTIQTGVVHRECVFHAHAHTLVTARMDAHGKLEIFIHEETVNHERRKDNDMSQPSVKTPYAGGDIPQA